MPASMSSKIFFLFLLFSWKKKKDFVHLRKVSLLFLNEPRAERRRLPPPPQPSSRVVNTRCCFPRSSFADWEVVCAFSSIMYIKRE